MLQTLAMYATPEIASMSRPAAQKMALWAYRRAKNSNLSYLGSGIRMAAQVFTLIYFFVAQFAFALVALRRVPRKLSIAFLLITGAAVIGSTLLITENVLLPYDMWLKRGMPERPF